MNTRLRTLIRASLGWLVIVAFVARGLIPVGYMPDFAGKSSAPALRICGGMKSGAPDTPATHHHEDTCPFSVNAVFGLDGLGGPALLLPTAIVIALLTLTAFVLSPQRRFGNSSPRAPPLFS